MLSLHDLRRLELFRELLGLRRGQACRCRLLDIQDVHQKRFLG